MKEKPYLHIDIDIIALQGGPDDFCFYKKTSSTIRYHINRRKTIHF